LPGGSVPFTSGGLVDTLDRLTAALADRYAIERELGQGGMATVYLARDLKHERDVALKVLRPELAAVLGGQRFLAEIKITARLDHPHILTLIDSGESDGFLWYVLPFVHGESLRDRLNHEKQLGLEEALQITKQVAGALDYAHRQGVVHRDIKPENILLHEGEAMLADFGIALAVKEAGGNRLTETGLSLGTPQYMSPEQATGDRLLDARSDVYSLGAVLYEMLAGEPPVTGPTVQAVIAKLLTERPTRLRVVRDTVPEGIETAVAKALAKTPADRFAGAAEFAAALAAGARPAERATRRLPATRRLVGAGLLVIAGIVWAVASRAGRGSTPSPFLAAVPVQLTTSGGIYSGVPSPDGAIVAYTEVHCEEGTKCHGDLVIRETAGEGVSTVVATTGHTWRPQAWSPDGRWVAFTDMDIGTTISNGLYIVPQRGGTPRRVAPGTHTFGGFVATDTLVLTLLESPRHWLRRVVASTGAVVDSILLPVRRYVLGVAASPGGTRLLVLHQDQFGSDSTTLSIVDRGGHASDSIRVAGNMRSWNNAVWAGTSDAVIHSMPMRSNSAEGDVGLVFVRRRIDGRGRFLPGADTLKTVADGIGAVLGVSADGSQLFYQMWRVGEVGLWTATRSDARAAFTPGRKIGSSTGSLLAWISPRGAWIVLKELSATSSGPRTRLTVEPFAGGERRVIEPALAGWRDLALAPSDDSIAVATEAGSGRTAVSVYPLPAGAPVPRGSFDGVPADLRWLADGRLVTPVDSGRVIIVMSRSGEVKDLPVPDSLGVVLTVAPSPFTPEFAVATVAVRGARWELMVHRLDPDDARYAFVNRSSSFTEASVLSWTTDGWLHLGMAGPGDERIRLYRAPARGGAWEAEPPIRIVGNASIHLLSQDGRRAVVRVRSVNTDIWVLRAAGPN
jgi:hypothetical protein